MNQFDNSGNQGYYSETIERKNSVEMVLSDCCSALAVLCSKFCKA